MENKVNSEEKIFLVINLSFFGDVLLTNTLCQNIKMNYPNSKVVFLVNTPFYEAAKNQACVDEVICFDKRGKDKGLSGLLKFANRFKYRGKVYAAFSMYSNDRGILISKLVGAKKIVAKPNFWTKYIITEHLPQNDKFVHMQDINLDYLTPLIGDSIKLLPIKYIPEEDEVSKAIKDKLFGKDLVALCLVSKQRYKDMPIENAVELIDKLNSMGKTPVFFGAGQECRKYADNLKKLGCVNFVDLTNVTTINQLADVLKICKVLISVDTGTLHLGCAVGMPVVGIFYRTDMIARWAPRDFLYNFVLIKEDYSVQNICAQMEKVAQK